MTDLNSGDKVEVEGSSGNRYVLSRNGDIYSCTCPAWQHGKEVEKRRTCKHLKAYRGEIAEKARLKFAPKSPMFQGQALEDIFRADLLDEAETLLDRGGDLEKASDLVEQAHRAKKQGEAISLVAGHEQQRWIEHHVTRCWKLRADVLAALAKQNPALQGIADSTKKSAEQLEQYVKDADAPKDSKPKLRIVKLGDES
jgi:hypothetical protein